MSNIEEYWKRYWKPSIYTASTSNTDFVYVYYNNEDSQPRQEEKNITEELEIASKGTNILLNSNWWNHIPNDELLNYYNRMKQIYDYIDNKAKIEVYKENEEMSNLNENVKLYTSDKEGNLCAISPYESRVYAAEVKETKMVVEDDGVKFAHITNLPFALISESVIPRIEDVQSINDKVVIVKFADGTTEKAILSDEDTFSLEQGISICITKKILNVVLNGANGSSAYNKLVDYGLKVYKDKEKNAKKKAEDEKKAKEAEQKRIEKIRKKRAKRKAKLREEQIEIQAEAYRRAKQTD